MIGGADARALGALFVLGLAARIAVGLLVPDLNDWDPAWYRHAALRILEGRSTTDVVWNYAWTPAALEHPLHMHWMPLPAWVLLPLSAVWPAQGDRATSMLLGATWGPLAWSLTAGMDRPRADRWLAGLLGASGYAWVAQSAIPDSVALSGALGGLLALALQRQHALAAALCASAFALTRNDGFLLAPFLVVSLPLGRGLAVAAAALGTWGVWTLRCVNAGGLSWWEGRQIAARATEGSQFLLGAAPPLPLSDRLLHFASSGLADTAIGLVFILPVVGLVALLLRARHERWLRGLLAYWVLMPALVAVISPAVATGGTANRTAALLAPLASAGFGLALGALGRWTRELRGYPVGFVPGFLVAGWVGMMWLLGPVKLRLTEGQIPTACGVALADDVPAFSPQPLLAREHCGRPGALIRRGMTPERIEDLADRFDIEWAVAPLEPWPTNITPDELRELLPGWTEASPGVFRRP